MPVVNLVKSIYTSTDVTALGEIASGDTFDIPSGSTGTGVVLTTPTLTNPTVTNYVETLFSANTGTAITINLANGTVQDLTLTGNAT
ncbi:hypothetical protein, partial [Limnohabitans sp.]|uniref:hypothetical protein n=1 Tax=Limnohabitans sp. TaxID=1907725 RepID=UPI00333E4F3B